MLLVLIKALSSFNGKPKFEMMLFPSRMNFELLIDVAVGDEEFISTLTSENAVWRGRREFGALTIVLFLMLIDMDEVIVSCVVEKIAAYVSFTFEVEMMSEEGIETSSALFSMVHSKERDGWRSEEEEECSRYKCETERLMSCSCSCVDEDGDAR